MLNLVVVESNSFDLQPSMVKKNGGCCFQIQIDLELEEKGKDWDENAQVDNKKGQFIDFYHLNVGCACKKKFDI